MDGLSFTVSAVVYTTMWLILASSPIFLVYMAWRFLRAYEYRSSASGDWRRDQVVLAERMRFIEERLDDLLRRQARLEEDHRLLSSAMTGWASERGARAG